MVSSITSPQLQRHKNRCQVKQVPLPSPTKSQPEANVPCMVYPPSHRPLGAMGGTRNMQWSALLPPH